jgi:NitT/TauT family transport system substrate-binding protein
MNHLLKSIPVAVAFIVALASAQAAELKPLIVAEPQHGTGYLPLYVAVAKGYFAEEGIDLHILTVESGSSHTNAVLTGQAFAFIGGPEHDAFAKLKGAELRSVVNVVDRGNVYMVAAKSVAPTNTDYTSYMKGKIIEGGFYGGTPNSITRYLLGQWHLDPSKDVTILEATVAGTMAAVKAGQAQIASVTEPIVTQGIRQGVWDEPFFDVPKELGPYAYSTLNVRLDSIAKEPATVEAFVRATIKGLRETYANPAEAAEIAHKEFPTMAAEDLKATLDRSFADNIWSKDGMVSRASWDTAKKVVLGAGILKADVGYDEIIDMQFVKAVLASSK